jgi:PAT family beta-lactamase induction signal transducer AmpG
MAEPSASRRAPEPVLDSGAGALRRKLAWVAILYFAEGFPFGIVVDNLPVYFRTHGVSLTEIGLMSLLGMPWTLKVLWAPLVDRFGERRQWIAAVLVTLGALSFAIPLLDPARPTIWLWAVLLAFTTASATQDIAIDAYTIGLLAPGEEGVANGVRVSAYRAALIVGGGGLVALAAWAGWRAVFWVTALVFVVLAVFAARSPRVGVASAPGERHAWLAPLWAWLRRPGAPIVFLFVLTYKLGDASMGPMVKPFWVDRGLSVQEIALVSTTFGVVASVIGALAGGVLTSRWGILRGLAVLGVAQAVSNLGYAAAAATGAGRAGIYTASLVESFTGGLGTAAFLSFLMNICDKEQAATEYALLSAIFSLTRTLAGSLSGLGTSRLGYATYFAATFVLALPGLALIPWLRPWIRPAQASPSAPPTR